MTRIIFSLKQTVSLGIAATMILLIVGCAQTPKQEPFEPEVVSIAEYQEFLDELREALKEGEPRELNPPETSRYERIDRRMTELLDQYDSVDEMDEEEQETLARLHHDLEILVSGRESEQVICRRERTVGTNFRQENCRTRADWEHAREQSTEYVRRNFRMPAVDPMGSM